MRIFKQKCFNQWAQSEGIDDITLKQAIFEIEKELYEVNLGAGLYKKRVAKKGQGKRGSYRMLIAFKVNDKAVFMYGFAKNERDNIGLKETHVYKRLAKYYLNLTEIQWNLLIKNGEFFEVI